MTTVVSDNESDEQGRTVTSTATAEEELRKQAIASLNRKRKFGQNLLAFVTVNGALWIIWALTDRSTDGSIPWPAWVSAIWGFFLLLDAWRTFARWPRGLFAPITERDIEREVERLGH
jgi:2TM domain-containing protein